MASLLCTWQPRRITWRWCGSFWRTAPARVSPLRYCTCVCVCFLCSHVCPFLCSMYPCIFYATVISKVFLSVVLTTSISSPPLFPSLPPFFLHPPFCLSLHRCLHLFVSFFTFLFLSISHLFCLTWPLSYLSPILLCLPHLLSSPLISLWGTRQNFIDW